MPENNTITTETFKPTKVYSKMSGNPVDLGIIVMFSVFSQNENPQGSKCYKHRNEFYLNNAGELVFETYSPLFTEPIAVMKYKVVQNENN